MIEKINRFIQDFEVSIMKSSVAICSLFRVSKKEIHKS